MAFSRETITNAIDKVREKALGLFQREPKAMDAFGGDDLYDGDDEDEGSSNLGPKIAIGVSAVLGLGLIGLVATLLMMGNEAVAPSGGSLAGLELEEDPNAGEQSAERRPWLTPTQPTGSRRLGVSDDIKSDDSKATADNAAGKVQPLPTREVAKVEPMKPPPAGQDMQAAKKPEPAKTADTVKVAEAAKPAEPDKTQAPTPPKQDDKAAAKDTKPGPAAKEATAETKVADAKPEVKTPAEKRPAEEEEQVAAMPSLLAPALTAPGAPRRFDNENMGAAAAGGKPRLNDPKLPPVEKTSIGAPPPRFAAIASIKPAAPPAGSTAKVAIVVEGLGLNKAATEAALSKLPPTVTLAFSPYARDLKRLMERAKQRGHEVLIEVPMESKGFPTDDPGPLGLLTSQEPKENLDRLETILKEASGAVGIFDSSGSKFRESQSHINDVFNKLKQSNLFYVQGRPGIRVGEAEIPSATADVVLDERPFRASVDARFDYVERLAKYQGSGVAVMDALPISFERLALWIDQLPKKGVVLAPVSQVLVQ